MGNPIRPTRNLPNEAGRSLRDGLSPSAAPVSAVASVPASIPSAAKLGEEYLLTELGLLYNYSHDDEPQFTRWQMSTAIRHGWRLAEEAAIRRARLSAAIEQRDIERGRPLTAQEKLANLVRFLAEEDEPASATEARRAETEQTGSVHDGAVPKGDARS